MLVETAATLALRDYNASVAEFIWQSEGIVINFKSSRTHSVGYQYKTLLWSVSVVLWYFISNESESPYREVSFTTYYSDESLLGFGQLLSAPVASNIRSDNSTISNQDITITDLRLLDPAKVYSPPLIYDCILVLLIDLAQKVGNMGKKLTMCYSERANATLVVSPTSAESEPLAYRDVVYALVDLANKMANIPNKYRWRSFEFRIRKHGRILGKGAWI